LISKTPRWRHFSKNQGRIGSVGTNSSIRCLKHKPEIRNEILDKEENKQVDWIDEDYKKDWK
jgi:hypothetical protein